MKVVYTSRAKTDLREIALFIARDNPVRARSFVRELRVKADEIGRGPLRWPHFQPLRDKKVRRRAFTSYGIYYVVTHDSVIVLRILHRARDAERWLETDTSD